MRFISAHKAYNTEWYCTSSKNPLRPLMRKTWKEKSILRTIFCRYFAENLSHVQQLFANRTLSGLWRGLSNLIFVMCLMSAWVIIYWKAGVTITVKHHVGRKLFFTSFVTEKGNGSRYTSFIENGFAYSNWRICTILMVYSKREDMPEKLRLWLSCA